MDGSSSSLYVISLNEQGCFHFHSPAAPHIASGPFRSLGEVVAAIDALMAREQIPTLSEQKEGEGLALSSGPNFAPFYTKLVPLQREPAPWSSWKYHITFKDDLFHAHPPYLGGPFDSLGEVAATIKLKKERSQKMQQYMDQADPAACAARLKAIIEKNRSAKSCKPSSDPAILKAVDRYERIMAKREIIENAKKWMQNEALRAFESAGYQASLYEFVKIDQQCLIHDTFSKSYHHYNFTMKKMTSKKHSDYQIFFAEVKPTKEGKHYFCCPLQPGENGDCLRCRKLGVGLRHPTSGNYEKGNEHSGFPFDSNSGGDD